jgi:hypothetical protein
MPKMNGKPKPKFKVGDWVWIVNGPHRLLARVVEDRGPLGVKGRRIYGLNEFPLWAPVVESEVAEDYLEPAERPEKLPEPHDALPVP